MFFDGSGNSKWGAVLVIGGKKIIWKGNGGETSNESEYMAVVEGLKNTLETFGPGLKLKIVGDSQLVIKQLLGQYRVRAENLIPFYKKAKELISKFDNVSLKWVRREFNGLADSLCR